MTTKQIKHLAALIGAFVLMMSHTAIAANLTVYTAAEAKDIAKYVKAFNKHHPDIKIKWVRDSADAITTRLLSEKNNPKADVVWGLSANSLLLLKSEGMLEPYKPQGIAALDRNFIDKGPAPSWVGMGARVASICYNTVEAAKYNLTPPKSWQDLLDPMYLGHIIMPDPNSSAGLFNVSGWLQMYGKKKAWEFMDALHDNIARYTKSSSEPCKLVAAGKIPIGISYALHAAKSRAKGAPIDIIVPREGVGWDMEATAIITGTDNLKAAQTLVDWSITRKANQMYSAIYAVVAYPGVAKQVKHFPTNLLEKMVDNDFQFAANNRKRIVTEWHKRYDSKSDLK